MAMHSEPRGADLRSTQISGAMRQAAPHAAAASMSGLQVRLVLTDFVAVTVAVAIAQFVRFGDDRAIVAGGSFGYTVVSSLLVVAWLIALWSRGAYREGQFGHGTEEFRSVIDATVRLFAAVALVSFVFQLLVARGFIVIAFPLGLLLLGLTRLAWRRWLVRERRAGRRTVSVLAVGDLANLQHFYKAINRAPGAGYRIAGICTDDTPATGWARRAIRGSTADAASVVQKGSYDVVAWTGSRSGSDDLRELGWALEGLDTALVVVPGLVDVAGPRVQSRPVSGVPLLYVDKPDFTGPKLVVKTSIDLVLAAILIVLTLPVQALVWLAVRFDSPGDPIFRQVRVGLNGQHFTIFKFRSMEKDAPERLALVQDRNDGAGLLFKRKDDPRITRVGHFIRRYSLDEIPQLYNVLRGDMSLVGPRPPLPNEVAQYRGNLHRRLLVKPGATGLWQVGGRNRLPWDESTRLDLFYVENWSVAGDLAILVKTVSAVLRKDGAY